MASITYRVRGQLDGERVEARFRNTDAGRAEVKAYAATLANPTTVYDVRTRIDGRVVTKTFSRRRDADAYATTTAADRLRGVAIDPRRGQITLEKFATDWLDKRTDLAERTEELYRWLLERYIAPTFGDVALLDLTPSAVRTWHAKIAGEHPTTAAKAYRLLSAMMRTAVADEIIARNPCQVKGAAVEKAPERPVATVAEVEALTEAMPEHLRVAVLLATWCQLRRGELLGLRRKDIDLMHGTVSVVITRTKLMSGQTIKKAPKTAAGRRVLALPSHVLPAVADHLQKYVGPDPDAPVLVGEKGGAVIPGVLLTTWDRARQAVGRPDLRLHDLRHTGLTLAAATGASVAELMKRAGHASPSAALRYQHATEDRDRVLADALSGLATSGSVTGIAARDTRAMERQGERERQGEDIA